MVLVAAVNWSVPLVCSIGHITINWSAPLATWNWASADVSTDRSKASWNKLLAKVNACTVPSCQARVVVAETRIAY